MSKNYHRSLWFALLIVALMALSIVARVSEHIPNIAPIAAIALFAGANLSLLVALLVPLVTMLISDSIIGFDQIEVTLAVYASFIITTLLGRVLKGRLRPWRVIGVSLLSSTLFYLITNAAVWWWSGMYERTLDGLLLSYLFALPFFRNTVMGDIMFTTSIFLAAHFMMVWLTSRSFIPALINTILVPAVFKKTPPAS